MKLSIAAFTGCGGELLARLVPELQKAGHELLDGAVLGGRSSPSLHNWTQAAFCGDAVLFIGACGIAVRAIAPFVRDKFSDPAVVSVDELGRFAVPLLSGHVGGANALAAEIAKLTGGTAVISTATDLHQAFAVDLWAVSQGLFLRERQLAKRVSAAILAGRPVGFQSDFPVAGALPDGLSQTGGEPLGICVTLDETARPFDQTLHLIPRLVTVGTGCRKGVDPDRFERVILETLEAGCISLCAVRQIATIDRKAEELCIRRFCETHHLPLLSASAQALEQVQGEFFASAFVRQTVGVDNVCERAAVLIGNGRLILRKSGKEGVTVAAAMPDPQLTF